MSLHNALYGMLISHDTTSQHSIDLTRQEISAAVQQHNVGLSGKVLDRLFTKVFSHLVYAQIWEDPVVDMQALKLGRNDRLITIASGGCNVLSYLTARPKEILAVDLNAHHLALTRLKLAALAYLPDHQSLYQFLGEADNEKNQRLFAGYIAGRLSPQDRRYWMSQSWFRSPRIAMFARNLYRFGVLGRFIGTGHRLARWHGVDLKALAIAPTLKSQQEIFERQIAPLFDRPAVRWLTSLRVCAFGLGIPPAQAKLLAAESHGDLPAVLKSRLKKLSCDFPIKENYFATQAFGRSYRHCQEAYLPPYLQKANHATVREMANRVKTSHRSMTDQLLTESNDSLDAYVLLDAQDWMTDDQLNALWQQIDRTARPGARVIFRTAGLRDILPGRVTQRILGNWRYNTELSAQLCQQDRSAIYGGFHLYQRPGK